ncbi:hydroxymethylpyrimidine/phosphomethylpyrimidine kinase [Geothrix rubra]|uniref:Hydroxymethylpyrimidine/phosphomethylpyrimidine kinase n=1 Tax=Geothrix rubra TaxID=2927977 RepID=A0ABQ5Q2H8_9BACT|nr:bifunctional hydroxymethylpyrimidine kinase/phosphomethylpyrimidine kinase [Geothrix rubra]GLH68641.1 hydroxymethylpyrimidine/phosphomethylpyrimidine kinase [Geothrix rubra]
MDPVAPAVPPIALCLGGMDPSGGAGILRDALTVAALGCHPMTVSLAETLQNGIGCSRIEPPSMDPVLRLECLALHLAGRWGVKLGLCALEPAQFHRLSAALAHLAPPVRIWDPILAPSTGVGLHDGGDLRRMAEALLPMGGWVVSPNRGEAAAFAGLPPEAIQAAEVDGLARPWLEAGAAAVWLKGGHAEGDQVQDFWITAGGIEALEPSPRLPGARRGTGCTLASAWLGLRLQGLGPQAAAVESARRLRDRWDRAWVPGGAGRPVFAPEAP